VEVKLKIRVQARPGCGGMDGGGLLDLLTFMAVLAFFSYASRELEIRRLANEIELYLTLFKAARDRAVSAAVRKFGEVVAKSGIRVNLSDLEARVKQLVDTVVISPESLDPFGLVRKLKHVLRSEEQTLKEEVKRAAPAATKGEVEVVADLINVARGLNFILKYVNHNYTLAKRFKSYWLLLQLDALLPFIAEEVRAYESAVEALLKQVPIGDSVGPLVLLMLAKELKAEAVSFGVSDTLAFHATYEGRDLVLIKAEGPGGPLVLLMLAKELKAEVVSFGVSDTLAFHATYEGRDLVLIKAEGPGSSVGRLDEAVRRALAVWGSSLSFVVTIDAMLKLEGELSGEIVEGYGVAIGGAGVEKYSIEEVLTEYNLTPYAILIKMSTEEALLPMNKELYEACVKAKEEVKKAVLTHVKPGAAALIVGVGNTLGVGN